MAWKDLLINPKIIQAVEEAKLENFSTVLTTSSGELQRVTHLSSKDIETLKKTVSETVVTQLPTSVFHLLRNPITRHKTDGKLTTGCSIFNKFLQGGILTQRLTEIVGESGSGKTQFCLQLALTSQLPECKGGLGGGVAYICTEDVFPAKRLKQMTSVFEKHHSNEKLNFTDNFFIHHVADLERLKCCLKQQLPALINLKKVKLVILDSVAVIFRSEYDSKDVVSRSQELQWVGVQLHRLCLDYEITVICTNQVTDIISSEISHPVKRTMPSLGLAWSNFITTRLMFRRTVTKINLPSAPARSQDSSVVVRTVEIIFAPHLPKATYNFIVDHEGMKGLEVQPEHGNNKGN